MEKTRFNKLLLKTAFSCMACDGDIDKREIEQIQKFATESAYFRGLNVKKEISELVGAINQQGHQFLRSFLTELSESELPEKEELEIIDVSIHTIEADEKIEYSEIKFFKIIRSKLKVSDEIILKKFPSKEEYLEEDILPESYLLNLQEDFFNTYEAPEFTPLSIENLE